MLKLAAELVPQHPRAAELSEQLREAVERQAAAEAAERLRRQIEELIRSASQRLQSADDNASDLATALREVNQVLALDPENAEAPRSQDRDRRSRSRRAGRPRGPGRPSTTPAGGSRTGSIRRRSACSKTINRLTPRDRRDAERAAAALFWRSRSNAEPNGSASNGRSASPPCWRRRVLRCGTSGSTTALGLALDGGRD